MRLNKTHVNDWECGTNKIVDEYVCNEVGRRRGVEVNVWTKGVPTRAERAVMTEAGSVIQ